MNEQGRTLTNYLTKEKTIAVNTKIYKSHYQSISFTWREQQEDNNNAKEPSMCPWRPQLETKKNILDTTHKAVGENL